MAWNYDPALPTDRDKVRALIGDTDTNDQIHTDEFLDFLLDTHGDLYIAAAFAVEAMAADLLRYTDVSADGVSVSVGTSYSRLMDYADRLRQLAASVGQPMPYAGGRSVSERETDDANSDLIQLHFRSHIHDNPWTPSGINASQAELAPDQ